ncbi:hypothetical protein [Nocardia gamkensis]|uniref:hypothetical protein n=1 Tax=Nocardia gamkensis TaxID=352869 RepID=UPI0037CB970B
MIGPAGANVLALTGPGVAFLLVGAAAVAIFAGLESAGLRRLGSAPTAPTDPASPTSPASAACSTREWPWAAGDAVTAFGPLAELVTSGGCGLVRPATSAVRIRMVVRQARRWLFTPSRSHG